MPYLSKLAAKNVRLAKKLWKDNLRQGNIESINSLTEEFGFSIARGDLQLLNGKLYVSHSGLLSLANREGCSGIHVSILPGISCPARGKYAFRALVRKRSDCYGFMGFGDADPSNVSPQMQGAEMRIAETRAVNRALRKAYGIGLCSLEELGSSPLGGPQEQVIGAKIVAHSQGPPPLLRDQISILIRKYKLDSELVKRYAAHFCGTEILKNARRELIEDFVRELAQRAADDLSGLQRSLRDFTPGEKAAS